MKFTLIAESESVFDSGSKITHEFNTHSAAVAVEQFTKFLRGSGIFFQGNYTVSSDTTKTEENKLRTSRSSDVFSHMANDLIKNPPFMEDRIEVDIGDITINYDNMNNMGDCVITGGEGIDIISISPQVNNCPLCNLPKDVMSINKCWDEKCPLNLYESDMEPSLR